MSTGSVSGTGGGTSTVGRGMRDRTQSGSVGSLSGHGPLSTKTRSRSSLSRNGSATAHPQGRSTSISASRSSSSQIKSHDKSRTKKTSSVLGRKQKKRYTGDPDLAIERSRRQMMRIWSKWNREAAAFRKMEKKLIYLTEIRDLLEDARATVTLDVNHLTSQLAEERRRLAVAQTTPLPVEHDAPTPTPPALPPTSLPTTPPPQMRCDPEGEEVDTSEVPPLAVTRHPRTPSESAASLAAVETSRTSRPTTWRRFAV